MSIKEDKDMLYQAIESYGKYTENQNKVLCALVNNAVDDMVFAPVTKLNKQTGVTRPTIYASLKVLQIDGIVTKEPDSKGLFKLNKDKISFIINTYKKNR